MPSWHRFAIAVLGLLFLAATADAESGTKTAKPIISPDRAFRVEQTMTLSDDDGRVEIAIRNLEDKSVAPLNGGEETGYFAGFRFTPDSKWLVRMQKTGAGWSTLYLYKRDGATFKSATPREFGQMALDYFFEQPASKGFPREPDHLRIGLFDGLEKNYRALGEKWPGSRYVVVTIEGNTGIETRIDGWRCVYDLQDAKFFVPDSFAAHNSKAVRLGER